MNTVTIIDNTLVVEPRGLDKFWALTRELRIPLGHVRGATVDPGAVHDYKGLRNPGLGVPGVKWAGTFTLDGERHFWNVTGSAATIVVQLADEHYDRIAQEAERHAEPAWSNPDDLVFTTDVIPDYPAHVFVFLGWRARARQVAVIADNTGYRKTRPLAAGGDRDGFAFALRAPP